MRFVVVSDTHCLHARIKDRPKGDALVHAAQLCSGKSGCHVSRRSYDWSQRSSWSVKLWARALATAARDLATT